MTSPVEGAISDLTEATAAQLLRGLVLPSDFVRFRDAGFRDRMRSATDSYFDLGDSLVEVEGGQLLHLISDSQWVLHWLLYFGDDRASAVVGTTFPAGFTLDRGEAGYWHEDGWTYRLLADSFSEFAWRWWMDNDLIYRVTVERAAMTAADHSCVEQYGSASPLQ